MRRGSSNILHCLFCGLDGTDLSCRKKMFKDRLAKWNVRKYLTAAELEAAEQLLARTPNRPARVNGRDITLDDVVRSRRRREIRTRCRSSVAKAVLVHNTSTKSAQPPLLAPRRVLNMSFFQVLDEVLCTVWTFVHGSFGSGTWIVAGDHEPRMRDGRGLDRNLQEFLAGCDAGFKILNMGGNHKWALDEAEMMLSLAIGGFRSALRPDMYAGVLVWSIDIVRKMRLWGADFALYRDLFQHFVTISSANLETSHPFRRLWELLATIDTCDQGEVLQRAHLCAVESFEKYLRRGKWVANARLTYIQRGEDLKAVERDLLCFLEEIESNYGPADTRLPMARYTLLCCLLNQRRHDEVIEMAQFLFQDSMLWPYLKWQCLEIQAVSERAMGRLCDAMRRQIEASEFALKTWGMEGSNYMNSLGSRITLWIVGKLAGKEEVAYACDCGTSTPLAESAGHRLDDSLSHCQPLDFHCLDVTKRLNSGSVFMCSR
jgi:hypothetical protein